MSEILKKILIYDSYDFRLNLKTLKTQLRKLKITKFVVKNIKKVKLTVL